MSEYTTGTGQKLKNVHGRDKCIGRSCPIHNPSDHGMILFKTHFREDRGFMERICSHGVGHPDPDDPFADPIHGCDGCCGPRRGMTTSITSVDGCDGLTPDMLRVRS